MSKVETNKDEITENIISAALNEVERILESGGKLSSSTLLRLKEIVEHERELIIRALNSGEIETSRLNSAESHMGRIAIIGTQHNFEVVGKLLDFESANTAESTD